MSDMRANGFLLGAKSASQIYRNISGFNAFAHFDSSNSPVLTSAGIFDHDIIVSVADKGSIGGDWDISPINRRPYFDESTNAAIFTTNRMLEIGDTSDFKWLHDSTSSGLIAFYIYRPVGVVSGTLIKTSVYNSSSIGINLRFTSTSVQFKVSNGSDYLIDKAAPTNSLPQGSIAQVVIKKTQKLYNIYINNNLVISESYSGEGSDSNSASSFSINDTITSSSFIVIPELIVYKTALHPSPSQISDYLSNKWGDLSSIKEPVNIQLYTNLDARYTLISGRVASVPNPGDMGGSMQQSTGGNRPLLVEHVAGDVLYFDRTRPDYLTSNLAASNFTRLHNGTDDATIAIRFMIDDLSSNIRILSTMSANNSNTGIILQAQTDGRFRVYVGNGSGSSYALDAFSDTGVIQAGKPHTLIMDKSGSDINIYIDGVLRISEALSSPSSSAPQTTLEIGQVGNYVQGYISDILILGEADGASWTDRKQYISDYFSRHPFELTIHTLNSQPDLTFNFNGQQDPGLYNDEIYVSFDSFFPSSATVTVMRGGSGGDVIYNDTSNDWFGFSGIINIPAGTYTDSDIKIYIPPGAFPAATLDSYEWSTNP